MSDNEFLLYEKDNIPFFKKYLILQHLLVTNQGNSQLEAFAFLSFYYIQFISGYFSPQLGVLNQTNSIDKFLSKIEKVSRLKNLFRHDYNNYKITCYIFTLIIFISGIYFILITYSVTKQSFYDTKARIVNPFIKFFIYILYNMILDMGIAHFCLKGKVNTIILDDKCSLKEDLFFSFSILITFIYSILMNIVCQIFNVNSFYLSRSYFSKVASQYDMIMLFHSIFYSILLNEHGFSKYFFLIYNLVMSIFIYEYYFYLHLYFEKSVYLLVGIYHSLYAWSSFLFLIFYIFPINNLGLIFLVSSLFVGIYTLISSNNLDFILIYKTPFNKIKNKYHALYFIKEIIRQINTFDEDEEKKILLIGILEIHKIECPNENCVSKNKKKIYLPKTDEWSLNQNSSIKDKIFLNVFVVSLINYWLQQNEQFPDMLLNLSLYYLKIIGNVCLSIYTYKKAKKLTLSQTEFFSFMRLKFMIRNHLFQNLKAKNKPVYNLYELNSTLYFKYEDLSKKFVQEITNDVNYSLTFWSNLKNNANSINFNEFFILTEKIRTTKLKITKLFNELFNIYNRANEIFELYLSYIDIINNDYLVKRNLEVLKRKNERQTVDLIQVNYYNILFGKDTGIIICSGDKGKEGEILTSNKIISELFSYTQEELKGKCINLLMPKNIAKIHSSFITRYFEIGERKIIGKKTVKCFAKDKENNIFLVKIILNLFPVLNDSVSFVSMLIKDRNDDIILLDNYFNILGLSSRLMYKLNIENKQLFSKYDIPFYAICKQFISLYKNISIKKKKKANSSNQQSKITNFEIVKTKSFIKDSKEIKNEIKNNNNNESGNIQNTNLNDSVISFELNNNSINNQTQGINNSTINEKLTPNNIATPTPDYSPTPNRGESKFNNFQKSFFFKQSFNEKSFDKTILVENNITNFPPPHQLLDYNENIELECEIRIPYFILNFRNNNKNNNEGEESDINIDSIFENGNEEESLDDSNNDDDENILIKDETPKTKNTNPLINKSNINSNINFNNLQELNNSNKNMNNNNNINNSSQISNNEKNNSKKNLIEVKKKSKIINYFKNENVKSEEEMIFLKKLNKFKILFFKGEEKELKDYIHFCNNEENITIENKFNLIFERYTFGNNEIIYCIKVFENKEADEFMDDEEEDDIILNLNSIEEKNEVKFDKKQKTESLKKIFPIFPEDRRGLIALHKEFLKLQNEDSFFKEILFKSKEEILKNSTCHGNTKQETLMEDENSSQTSASAYNEDLSKKNRIEEIRNNALKNVSNFYMLKYYSFILIIIICLSIIFLVIVIRLFDNLRDNLSEVTNINNKLYQTTNWLTFVLCSLISFDTLYIMKNSSKYNFTYNTFIPNLSEYIYTLQDMSLIWIDNIVTNFSLVEKAIATFTEESRNIFWEKEEILDYYNLYDSYEPYPFALYQVLTCAKLLVGEPYFASVILNDEKLSYYHNKSVIYQAIMSINNGFRKFLPNNLEKIKELPRILQKFNNNSMVNIKNSIIIYGTINGCLIILYTFILYKTNKSIDDGFEKVSKIKQDKIEETIKKIEQFNSILKKFIEVNYNENSYYFDTKTIFEKEDDSQHSSNTLTNIKSLNQQDANLRIDNEEQKKKNNLLVSEIGKKQSLQLFTWSYLQPLILAIICIQFIVSNLLVTRKIIDSTNEIIDIQTFLYELVLSASTSLLDLKYSLTYYNTEKNISYVTQNSHYSLQVIVTKIAKFDEILNLYNNMQINICDAAFDKKTDVNKYNACLIDPIVQTVNNTNSIFNSIENEVNDLLQLMEYYISLDKNYETIELYNSNEIEYCEYLYYNYLVSFIDNIAAATLNNQKKALDDKNKIALIIYVLVIIEIVIYSAYIWIFFLKKIIYYLSVARCILRIIPISVINSTPDVANWIENNYNS